MTGGQATTTVWVGAIGVLLGLVLLVTPTGVHHDGSCGSVLAPRHPVLRSQDLLQEQVSADGDCRGERRFRAAVGGLAATTGLGVAAVGVVGVSRHARRRSSLPA